MTDFRSHMQSVNWDGAELPMRSVEQRQPFSSTDSRDVSRSSQDQQRSPILPITCRNENGGLDDTILDFELKTMEMFMLVEQSKVQGQANQNANASTPVSTQSARECVEDEYFLGDVDCEVFEITDDNDNHINNDDEIAETEMFEMDL